MFFLIFSIYAIIFYISDNQFSAHEFCPYSQICFGIASLSKNIVNLIFPITVIIGIILTFLTLFFGRFFCGYICPIGTIQRVLYIKKGKRLKLKKLHFIKYIVLILTVVSAYNSFQYVYMKFCPVLFLSYIKTASFISVIFFVIVILLSLFHERFFCKVLCPYGALLNIMLKIRNLLKIPSYKIKKDTEVCVSCKLCSRECPMDIEIHENETISNPECILCMRCIKKCPKNNGLSLISIKQILSKK